MKEYKIFTFYEKCMEKVDYWRQISDKKGSVKKNVRLQLGQNQKFLIYKLFRLIFVTTCIEGIFDFSKIEARFFFTEKNICGFTFHPVKQIMYYFGNHLPVAVVLKLK